MDIENLLKLLNDRNVRYVIIGAMAFPVHGYSRITLDTDIFIEPTQENAEKIMDALQNFGYDISDISINNKSNITKFHNNTIHLCILKAPIMYYDRGF